MISKRFSNIFGTVGLQSVNSVFVWLCFNLSFQLKRLNDQSHTGEGGTWKFIILEFFFLINVFFSQTDTERERSRFSVVTKRLNLWKSTFCLHFGRNPAELLIRNNWKDWLVKSAATTQNDKQTEMVQTKSRISTFQNNLYLQFSNEQRFYDHGTENDFLRIICYPVTMFCLKLNLNLK